MTAFSRKPTRSFSREEQVRTVHGDVLDQVTVGRWVPGHDAVLWAIGRSLWERGGQICSRGMQHVVSAMRSRGVSRLIVESAFGAGDSRDGGPFASVLRRMLPGEMRDKDAQELIVQASGLDWVLVRPTILTRGPLTLQYIVRERFRAGWFPRVARADVAHFMLDQVEQVAYLHRAVTITSGPRQRVAMREAA